MREVLEGGDIPAQRASIGFSERDCHGRERTGGTEGHMARFGPRYAPAFRDGTRRSRAP
ncbi:hypothetical protein NicSoilB11_36280 [Arthrobacter sp. NicSoilB11]|nr:hypothetical protein NicSoilB11_36280 [Arthrobacter sp. NicSoilB11]